MTVVREFAVDGYLFTICVDREKAQALVVAKEIKANGEHRSLFPICQHFDLSE